MTKTVDSIENFDTRSPDFLKDPHAALQDLILERPCFYSADLGAYVVLGYENVRNVLGSDRVYSSVVYQAVPVRAALRDRIPAEWERAGQVIQGGQVMNMDAPVHTPQRRAMQRSTFTHKRVGLVKPDVAAIANELVDELVDRGSADLMQDFGLRLTSRVVGSLLDLPEEMLSEVQALLLDVFAILAPIDLKPDDVTTPDDELVASYERVHRAYLRFSEFVERRRAKPGDDLASVMIALEDDDGQPVLSNDDVIAHMVGIAAAGTDTTANLITNMVRFFTECPEQLQILLEDPSCWPGAVQEGLRRSPVSLFLFRISTEDSEIAGQHIPARSTVCLCLPGANADPAKFPDPLRFDVRRQNAGDHLALGRGRHFCLGSPLAPPEAQIALETLYRRLPGLRADLTQQLEYLPSIAVRGLVSQQASWNA